MPWTYGTVLIGAIASAGVPGFAGFFSKDAIIEAVHLSKTPGAGFAWLAVTACVFVTAFYTFRMVFYEFHGVVPMMLHAVYTLPFWLSVAGIAAAGYLYLLKPELHAKLRQKAGVLVTVLEEK